MKTQISPRLTEACTLAHDALNAAIAAVDAILDDDSAAIEYPELVVAFTTFAASAYRSAEEAPAIH
ncbi:hypothetical protein [Bradyrhizobium sp.]|uniref:hypothetical protein n=1 Tax=Bradyrhizobium sp. TaxID=376 RepID=UPI0025BA2EB4|nr:hypothetical protein [Bradyrhizobium sp.]